MDNADKCYEVRFVNGQGNGLFATRAIVPGELIFREFPFVWNGFKNVENSQSSFCYTCGCTLQNEKLSLISCAGCQVHFCSIECESLATLRGHRFVCPAYCNSGLVDIFTQTDRSGHFALALQCYAQIAAEYVRVLSNTQPLAVAPDLLSAAKQASHTILGSYHADDFCRSKHAIRTGQLEILSENMFETMIAPAYFTTSGLEDAQTRIFNEYAALPLSVWATSSTNTPTTSIDTASDVGSSVQQAQAEQIRAAFLHVGEGGLFTPMFFRKLIGTFSVNNHHVHLQHSIANDTAHSTSEPVTVFKGAIATATEPAAAPLQLLGTALYPTVSKMNHSCECNTTNAHSRQDVQLAVYSTANIAKGAELTTTYLHQLSPHAKPQSRRSRQKALLQYLFSCKCAKCESELQQQRDERNKRRAAAGKAALADSDSDSEGSEEEEESSSDDDEEGTEHDSSSACY